MNDVDRCLICGEVIPEGSQVCTACRNKYDIVTGETEEMAQELRDIADVLKITEGTDTNIRKSMAVVPYYFLVWYNFCLLYTSDAADEL